MDGSVASTDLVLDIERLGVSYFTRAGAVPAVTDFSLRMRAGEAVGLVGESGCGKSTVAMAIMRYMGRNGAITAGAIRFRGRDLLALSGEAMRRLRGAEIAMVYQEPMAALNPSLTIGRQLMEVPLYHDGVGRREAWERARALLADVQIPDPDRLMAAYPHQISGGQQQRAVIAMALLSRPALLLLDEPTTALDVTVEAGIVELIAGIAKRYGTSILYISHNLGLILDTCDRVAVMYSGQVVEEAPVARLFAEPRHPYTRGLFDCIPLPSADKLAQPLTAIPGQLPLPQDRPAGCNFGPRCWHFRPGRCDAGDLRMAELVHPAPDHRVRCVRWDELAADAAQPKSPPRRAEPPGETVLEVVDAQKYYEVQDRSLGALLSREGARTVKANEQLTFSARRGETLAIVGESGCGKSTFARVLVGLETTSRGDITFRGAEIGRRGIRQRTAGEIGALQMVFQNPNDTLNPSHTVGSQIARVVRRLGGISDPARVRERVLELFDLVKLPRAFLDRRPRQLSGGQKQRIGIARAFAGRPALVIADEPVSALDVSVQAAVTELLMDIQRQYGTTLLFISHDLSVVHYLADRVVVMYLGRIMERGTTEQIFQPPYHPYTEALLSAVPVADASVRKRRIVLEGALPSPLDPPKGCPFSTRCPRRVGPVCDEEPPPEQTAAAGHAIACHIPVEELARVEPVMQAADDGDVAA